MQRRCVKCVSMLDERGDRNRGAASRGCSGRHAPADATAPCPKAFGAMTASCVAIIAVFLMVALDPGAWSGDPHVTVAGNASCGPW